MWKTWSSNSKALEPKENLRDEDFLKHAALARFECWESLHVTYFWSIYDLSIFHNEIIQVSYKHTHIKLDPRISDLVNLYLWTKT